MSHLATIRYRMGARRLPVGAAAVAAVLVAAAPAPAEPPAGFEASALKASLGHGARAAGIARLPLGGTPLAGASAARRNADLRALAAASGPARVLIAARAHRHVPGLARDARALGSDVRVYERTGLIGLTAAEPARLVAELGRDPRVTSLEPNRTRRIAADPADRVDAETGIPFGWAFDAVRAGPALAAIGGGTNRLVAVIDTGVDVNAPDIREQVTGTFNSLDGSSDASDGVGHGTFVSGLISMTGDNDIGGRGVGGRTAILGIRADNGAGEFSTESLVVAKETAVRRRAHIMNMSLGGDSISESETRALELAFLSDVLPVAASGNGAERGNPVEFPAAAVGGRRGEVGIGLSVAATKPDGAPAGFSTHNAFVSVAAPGAGAGACAKGVFSTIPQNRNLIFDDPTSCSDVFTTGPGNPGGRYGYSEGTSFATPIVSGVAAVAWHVEPRLASEQVADVLQRSARQTFGAADWNQFTGHGVVDAPAAIELAGRYDVLTPRFKRSSRRSGRLVRIRVFGGQDRTDAGDELAGEVTYLLARRERDGDVDFIAGPRRGSLAKSVSGRRSATYVAVACDGNGNCGVKPLRVRGRR